MEGDGHKDILWLLYESVNYESTDIRDRIYALVGMCDDPDIEVDYHKSPTEAFTSFAKHVVMRAASLGRVLDQSCKYGKQSDLDLPYWVPDWRTLDLIRYEPQTVKKCEMSSSFDRNRPHVLELQGYLLGKVEMAKAKKQRPPNKIVHLDWARIRNLLEESYPFPDFLTNVSSDTITLDFARKEIRPGDILIAACGSDDFILLRSNLESGCDEYEFVSCVFSDKRKRLRTSLLEYGVENDVLETFTVV